MKTLKLVTAIVVFLIGTQVHAQHRGMGQAGMQGPKYQKLMEKKMVFMKENLMLTPSESKAFEAAYKKYAKEKMQLRQEMQKEFRLKIEKGQYLELSDNELNKLLDKKMELENKRLKIEMDFQKELRRILPPKKVIKYYRTERNFNRKMLAKMRKGKKMQRRNKKTSSTTKMSGGRK